MNIDALKEWIRTTMDNLPEPKKEGAIIGMPASWYVECTDRPILRIATDGIVREIDCDLVEEDQIIQDTDPVDFARQPNGTSTIFIWYRIPGNYKEVFREHRQQSEVKQAYDLREQYLRETGFLKPLPKKK
jgi:hypothetical protein